MSAGSVLRKVLDEVRDQVPLQDAHKAREYPKVVRTNYTSLPVSIPPGFLAPLEDPSKLTVSKIDFANSPIPGYKSLFAVVIDNVLTAQECEKLLHLAEQSAGAHGNGPSDSVENNGWRPAMVNAGRNREFLATDYRNSDRIVWDNQEIAYRLWLRVLQGEGMEEYFGALEGEAYKAVIGERSVRLENKWTPSKEGLNERLRFLKYGPGQYFKEHCDGAYETPDGAFRSFYTLHLYLNDSAQALGIPESDTVSDKDPKDGLLRGGATPFFSMDMKRRVDVDPKAGRVLIFQQNGLLHSGDTVTSGTKYTMRSDLMYQMTGDIDQDSDIVFG